MTGITHAAAGAALGAVLAAFEGHELVGAAVGAAAALLPDMDHPGSYSGRLLRPLAVWLEEKYGHRDSPTHTLIFCLTVGLLLGILAGLAVGSKVLIVSGIAGAISHLFLDGMTRSGIQPLRVYLPGPPRLPEKSSMALQVLTSQWKRAKVKTETSSWFQKKWSGPIYTGKDPREFALAVFCICLTGLLIVI